MTLSIRTKFVIYYFTSYNFIPTFIIVQIFMSLLTTIRSLEQWILTSERPYRMHR